MSRIGKLPVTVPDGVKVTVEKDSFVVQGPKGTLTQAYEPQVKFEMEEGTVRVMRLNDSKRARAMHGLYRQLLQNMITGVSQGFSIALAINGVGYRAEAAGKSVRFNLGYSNPIEFVVPEGVDVAVEGPNKVVVSGIDKQKVGKIASEIRGLRPPEPYKGKGVKYETETIRRKVGKSGVK
ncbi:MAG: 50S ribosomal protein L6 [Spirochaetaceae bacterium]|nr:MAG: 50S ribosomal protein L6 [Spirochaetaceae bacterium]